MTSTPTNSRSKRRRTTATGSLASPGAACLSQLQYGIVGHAASFLSSPSRALFAIALTDGNGLPNEVITAIVGDHWDTLDFGEVEKDLAVKLSDDHIKAMLLCINALGRVRRLRLTNCINITGAGLEPLRGSAIMEQIDLSLIGDNESPVLYPEPSISCDHVLPILDSIIQEGGSTIKHLQFPYVWRKQRSVDSEFQAFVVRYNHMREDRHTIDCLKCRRNLPIHPFEWIDTGGGETYGAHAYTCFGCLKNYCYDCENEEKRCFLTFCSHCQRDYCINCCSRMERCQRCCEEYCTGCRALVECSRSDCDTSLFFSSGSDGGKSA